MIWLTWRQLRIQAAVVSAALVALAVVLALTASSVGAGADARLLGRSTSALYTVGAVAVLALPAIIGVFWGAPLISRELEAGTHRLAWTQTVTRTRWVAGKVGLTGLAAIAAAALLSLVVTWWCGPIDTAIDAGRAGGGVLRLPRVTPVMFDARGIAPIGHTAFAFALGVAAGTAIRRTVPAMALTLAVFVAVQIAVPTWIRPQLAPTRITTPITAANLHGLIIEGPSNDFGPVHDLTVETGRPGAWVTSNRTVDAAGHAVGTLPPWVARCAPGLEPGSGRARRSACFARLAAAGYRQRVSFQAAGRYWTLQALETAVFAALALGLGGFTFWWVRRRLA
jgi:hypothetical protein